MKRDARIGLAVVLVLGLAVTLLIGRALYRPATDVADAQRDESLTAGEDNRRVNGADATRATTVSAPLNPQDDSDARSETVILPQPTGAVREFIDDNTRTLGADRFNGSPAMTTPVTSNPTAHHGGSPLPRTTADGPAPIDADHESHPPVTPVVTPPATTTDGFGYTVAAGDNVWKISSKVYGDGKFTQKIVDANKDLNLAKLKPGMIVRIPAIQNKTVLLKLPAYADAKKVKPASTESAIAVRTPAAVVAVDNKPVSAERRFRVESTDAKPSETASVASTHKVAAGETLASIAKKYYATNGPKTIAKIIEANKGLDPAKLKVGQEIVMPALTIAANK